MNKCCSICKVDKDVSAFHKNKNEVDGLLRQCKDCNNTRSLLWHKDNSYNRDRLYRRHGINQEVFQEIWESQNGQCAICHNELQLNKDLSLDHDHGCCPKTYSCGKCIRGLLCGMCNKALGGFKDSVEILISAIGYLDKGTFQYKTTVQYPPIRNNKKATIALCPLCGSTKSKTAKSCKRCMIPNRRPERIKWPTNTELANMIDSGNYSVVAATLGISATAVGKRVRSRKIILQNAPRRGGQSKKSMV